MPNANRAADKPGTRGRGGIAMPHDSDSDFEPEDIHPTIIYWRERLFPEEHYEILRARIPRFRVLSYRTNYFGWLSLTVLLANLVTLAMYDPFATSADASYRIFDVLDLVFITFFLLELLLKLVLLRPKVLMSSGWNRLDILIIVASLLSELLQSVLPELASMTALRAVRVLRPFRAIGKIQVLRVVVNSMLRSLLHIFDVVVLFILFLTVFATAGVVQFKGRLRFQCVRHEAFLTPSIFSPFINKSTAAAMITAVSGKFVNISAFMALSNWTLEDFVCGARFDKDVATWNNFSVGCIGGTRCDLADPGAFFTGTTCPYGYACAEVGNPSYGYVGFDNLVQALLTVQTTTTLEGWFRLLSSTVQANGPASILFCLGIAVIGTFFIVNVLVAIVNSAFSAVHEEEANEAIRAKLLKAQTARRVLRYGSLFARVKEQATQLMETYLAQYLNLRSVLAKERHVGGIYCMQFSDYEGILVTRVDRFRCWMAYHVVETRAFLYGTSLCMVLMLVTMAVEHNNMPKDMVKSLEWVMNFFVAVIAVELVLRCLATQPLVFCLNSGNVVGIIVVVVSIVDFALAEIEFSTVRVLRLVISFKLMRLFPTLYQNFLIVIGSIRASIVLMAMITTYLFLMATLGMQVLGGKFCGLMPESEGGIAGPCADRPRENFDRFSDAMMTAFQVLCTDGWVAVLYNGMRSTSSSMGAVAVALLFVLLYCIGVYMLLNLFIAILINSTDAINQAMPGMESEEEEKEEAAVGTTVATQGGAADAKQQPEGPKQKDAPKKKKKKKKQRRFEPSVVFAAIPEEKLLSRIDFLHDYGESVFGYEEKHQERLRQEKAAFLAEQARKEAARLQRAQSLILYVREGNHKRVGSGRKSVAKAAAAVRADRPYPRDDTVLSNNSMDYSHRLPVGKEKEEAVWGVPMQELHSDGVTSGDGWDNDTLTDNRSPSTGAENSAAHRQQSPATSTTAKTAANPAVAASGAASTRATPASPTSPQQQQQVDADHDVRDSGSEGSQASSDDDGTGNDSHLDNQALGRCTSSHRSLEKLTRPPEVVVRGPFSWLDILTGNARSDVKVSKSPRIQKFRRFCRFLVANRISQSFFLIMVLLSTISLAIESPILAPDQPLAKGLLIFDYVSSAIFFLECMLKVIAHGFIVGERSYLRRTRWNGLDFLLMLLNIVTLVLANVGNTRGLRSTKVLYSFRPLRFLRRSKGMRIVVKSLWHSIRPMKDVMLVIIAFWVVYAIVGVQFFMGKFDYCDAPDTSRVVTKADCLAIGGVWSKHTFNFDHIGSAMLALFVVSTLQGWTTIMYHAMDAVGKDMQPKLKAQPLAAWYFIAFALLGGFLFLNLFVSVIIHSYEQQRARMQKKNVLLTAEQTSWLETQKKIFASVPLLALAGGETDDEEEEGEEGAGGSSQKRKRSLGAQLFSRILRLAFTITTSRYFDRCINLSVAASVVLVASEYYPMSSDTEQGLFYGNTVITGVYALELVLRILALGPSLFWTSNWFRFDSVVILGSILDLVLSRLLNVIRNYGAILRSLRIIRLLRAVDRNHRLSDVVRKFMAALYGLANVTLLLMLFVVISALFCMRLFGNVRRDYTFITPTYNFESFGQAVMMLLSMLLGGPWPDVMNACRYESAPSCNPNIGDCGANVSALLFFTLFVVLGDFVLINIFVAIVVDTFDSNAAVGEGEPKDDDDGNDQQRRRRNGWGLGESQVAEFVEAWLRYDADRTLSISGLDLLPLLRSLCQEHPFHPPVVSDMYKITGQFEQRQDFAELRFISKLTLTEVVGRVEFFDIVTALTLVQCGVLLPADVVKTLRQRFGRRYRFYMTRAVKMRQTMAGSLPPSAPLLKRCAGQFLLKLWRRRQAAIAAGTGAPLKPRTLQDDPKSSDTHHHQQQQDWFERDADAKQHAAVGATAAGPALHTTAPRAVDPLDDILRPQHHLSAMRSSATGVITTTRSFGRSSSAHRLVRQPSSNSSSSASNAFKPRAPGPSVDDATFVDPFDEALFAPAATPRPVASDHSGTRYIVAAHSGNASSPMNRRSETNRANSNRMDPEQSLFSLPSSSRASPPGPSSAQFGSFSPARRPTVVSFTNADAPHTRVATRSVQHPHNDDPFAFLPAPSRPTAGVFDEEDFLPDPPAQPYAAAATAATQASQLRHRPQQQQQQQQSAEYTPHRWTSASIRPQPLFSPAASDSARRLHALDDLL